MLIDFVPQNTSLLLKSKTIERLKNSIENTEFLTSITRSGCFKNLKNKLKPLSYINSFGEVLICFSKQKNDSIYDYTFITTYNESLFLKDSLKNYVEEELYYKANNITKATLQGQTFYSTLVDSVFVLSSSPTIIKNITTVNKNISDFNRLYELPKQDDAISIISKGDDTHLSKFLKFKSTTIKPLFSTARTDVNFTQDGINFHGVATSTDSSKTIINIFKNTIPQKNTIPLITPNNCDGVMSFTFNNFDTLQRNLKQFNKADSLLISHTLFNNIVEVGIIYNDTKRAIVLNSTDVIATNDALLSEQNKINTYRDIPIFQFSKPTLFFDVFKPLVATNNISKYCIIDNYFVFSSSLEQLQRIIASYQNKTTFGQQNYYTTIQEHLSSSSSLQILCHPKILKDTCSTNFNTYDISALQFVYDSNFAHVHGGILKTRKKEGQHAISESFSIKLDANISNYPQLVKNHVTNQKDIVVQDVNNMLYLISNKGQILWKKKLSGNILGEIKQVDIYKNGRLQLAFATKNRVYVLDRKGKDVGAFPLKFKDDITQPLSVFDYDNTKTFRLLVTQGKNVLMYNTKGNIVKGFSFKKAQNTIICQPKHFKINTKDYIVFKTSNKLYILNRTGNTRITPKTQYTYAKTPVFLYQQKFATTTKSGSFVSFDTKGNSSKINLSLGENHYLATTNKTKVTWHDNKLGINSRELNLDYGDYSKPKIFYVNDNIYVSVTDLQAKKVYVYNSQGVIVPNFPVYGSSAIALDNADNDKNLEFVVKGDINSILLYKIH